MLVKRSGPRPIKRRIWIKEPEIKNDGLN
jgi:hypothetical protein